MIPAFPSGPSTILDPGEPGTIWELREALTAMTAEGLRVLGELPPATFFALQGTRWSPAEHIRHLRKSSAPLVPALRLPWWLLRLLFGRPRRPSRTYATLRDDYRTVLAAGGQAGRFAPSPETTPSNPERRLAEILAAWRATNAELTRALGRWEEVRVDAVRLPHPLLGRLTVREMAAFTVYHTVHHLRRVMERVA